MTTDLVKLTVHNYHHTDPLIFPGHSLWSLIPLPPQGPVIQPSCLSQERPGPTLAPQPDFPVRNLTLKLQGQMFVRHVSNNLIIFPLLSVFFFDQGRSPSCL